jgi:hypothetical protein
VLFTSKKRKEETELEEHPAKKNKSVQEKEDFVMVEDK